MQLIKMTRDQLPLINSWLLDSSEFVDYGNLEKIFETLGENNLMWVLTDNGMPIGFAHLEINWSIGYFSIYLRKQSRGDDHSQTLLKLLESEAKKLKVNRLVGSVETTNIPSVKSLEKAGYISLGTLSVDNLLEYSKNL
jgi:L-amino acid N-acyltransferase YncA